MTEQITFFFPLGGKSLFLGADGGGGEGDRNWVRKPVVPFRGQNRVSAGSILIATASRPIDCRLSDDTLPTLG